MLNLLNALGNYLDIRLLLLSGFILTGLYFIFAKNPVPLNTKRLVRIYLYTFLFLGIIVFTLGLSSMIAGGLSSVFKIPMPASTVNGGLISANEPSAEQITKVYYPDTENSRLIVSGFFTVLIGLIYIILHYLSLKTLEGAEGHKTLLRKLFIGSGMLLYGVLILTTLLSMSNDLAYAITSRVQERSLVANLTTLLAVLPAALGFALAGYANIRKDLGLSIRSRRKA